MKMLRKILLIFLNLYLYVIDGIIDKILSHKKLHSFDLVLIKTDALGDAILLRSLLKKSRIVNPKKILLICDKKSECLYKDLDIKIFSLKSSKFKFNILYRIHMKKCLSHIFAKEVINAVPNSRYSTTEAIVKSINSLRKIRMVIDETTEIKYFNKISLKKYELVVKTKFLHEYFRLKQLIDISKMLSDEPNFKKTKNHKIDSNSITYAITASDNKRIFDSKKAAIIIQELLKYKFKITLIGDKSDTKFAEDILEELSESLQNLVINKVGKISLSKIEDFVSNSNFILCYDSFIGHLATDLSIPNLVILGGGNFGRFFPYPIEISDVSQIINYDMPCYNCNWQCNQNLINNSFQCIGKIDYMQVCCKILDTFEGNV